MRLVLESSSAYQNWIEYTRTEMYFNGEAPQIVQNMQEYFNGKHRAKELREAKLGEDPTVCANSDNESNSEQSEDWELSSRDENSRFPEEDDLDAAECLTQVRMASVVKAVSKQVQQQPSVNSRPPSVSALAEVAGRVYFTGKEGESSTPFPLSLQLRCGDASFIEEDSSMSPSFVRKEIAIQNKACRIPEGESSLQSETRDIPTARPM